MTGDIDYLSLSLAELGSVSGCASGHLLLEIVVGVAEVGVDVGVGAEDLAGLMGKLTRELRGHRELDAVYTYGGQTGTRGRKIKE